MKLPKDPVSPIPPATVSGPKTSDTEPTSPSNRAESMIQGPSTRPGRPPLLRVQAFYYCVTDTWVASCPLCRIVMGVKPGDPHTCCGEQFEPVEVMGT